MAGKTGILAAVMAVCALLAGCSSGNELPEELQNLEVGGAKKAETTTTASAAETQSDDRTEESESESKGAEETKEIMDYSKSMTCAFSKKLEDGDFVMMFDKYDVISTEDTTLYASYTVREHGGITCVSENMNSGTLNEYYLTPDGDFEQSTVNGESGDIIRTKKDGLVNDILMCGVSDGAKIVSVQEYSDGTIAEKAVFGKNGEEKVCEYIYDRETGALRSMTSDSTAVSVSTFTEGTEDIVLPEGIEETQWLER